MNNYLTDLNVLYDAYLASMKGSSWKNEPQKFEINFLSEIVSLKHDLESHEYKTLPGIQFTLNERGKIRHIHGARMRDRVVRHALCDNSLHTALQPFLIYNNGASQKGKGLTFARKMFEKDLHNFWLKYNTNDGYIGFIDLSKFYDNIRHDLIKKLIFPKLDEESVWLLNEILKTFEIDVSYMSDEEYENCLNERFDSVKYYEVISDAMKTGEKFMAKSVDIGDQVSQDIGVFFPTRLDNYAKIVRGCKFYGRYMDDIYIICKDKEELESIIKGIMEQAKELGLFINEHKTHIAKLSDTYCYLQTKYSLKPKGGLIKRINPKSVTRERRRIKAYKRLLDKHKMTYEDIEMAVKSWMGGYASVMSKKQIKHMKALYQSLFGKELIWKQSLSSKTVHGSGQKRTATA